MKTLDEAIKHCEEKAEEKQKDYERACAYNLPSEGCLECAEDHRQLAEWLKELKALREQKRPHGKWTEEFDENANPFFQRRWRCSACNDYNYYGKPDFCPCCGADMREGDPDDRT